MKKIIEKIKAGDQSAFRKLVEEHQQYAFNLAFRILCEEEEARDCVQESFIKVWKNIRSFNMNRKFTTWLYRIVTNTALDKYRNNRRQHYISLEDSLMAMEKLQSQDLETRLENRDLGIMIRMISEELPEKQRLVFILRDIQGFETSEVKSILEMPETAIKSNLYHARRSIRQKMEKLLNYERRPT